MPRTKVEKGTRSVIAVVVFFLGLFLVLSPPGHAEFTDVSVSSGLIFTDHTYGLGWGDFDSDEDPDLLVVRHFYRPMLYRNLGDGRFSTVFFPQLFDASDHHGPLIADFDEDGDLDLYLTSGADAGSGTVAKKLYRNDGGFSFVNVALESGVADTLGRGRSSSAMDFDNDGEMDLFVAKAPRAASPNSLFKNLGSGQFGDVAQSAGVADAFGSVGGAWGDYDNDRDADLIIGGEEGGGSYETRLYRNEGAGAFTNVTSSVLPGVGQITSADWGDFDEDGDLDLAVGYGDEAYFDALSVASDTLRFFFNARGTDNGLDGFAFTQTADSTNYELYTNGFYQPETIFISEDSFHPGFISPFQLDFDDIHGAPSFIPGQSLGAYVWSDSLFGIWQMRCNTPPAAGNTFAGTIAVNGDFTDVAVTELEPYVHGPRGTQLWRNDGGVFQNVSFLSGITDSSNIRQVGWFDYDLDGNVDLFAMNKGDTQVQNQPDHLYRNLGNGQFSDVTWIESLTGPSDGMGDAFSVEDYDLDGDLDMAMVNGPGPRFFSLHTTHKLYRNDRAPGNFLRVDLEGTHSTRDGYGAWVTCISPTAGRQSWYVTGNSWRGGHTLLEPHFGLGADIQADTLRVVWPSSAITVLTNVPSGRVVVNETEPVTGAPLPSGAAASEKLELVLRPNPARGNVEISFVGERREDAVLEIFEISGRAVFRSTVEAGALSFRWDGLTQEGHRVSAGIYYVRVRTLSGAQTPIEKLVLAR